MKKILCIILLIVVLMSMSIINVNADTNINSDQSGFIVPATGDITSVLALALAGVAAIGGLLLRKAK